MKTSFTKLFREKWKAVVPFLFFCMMSLGAYADFTPCGNLTSMKQVTVTLTCDGKVRIGIDKYSAGTGHYTFGSAINAQYGQIGDPFYKETLFDHGTTNLDSLSGKVFYVSESCYGQPLFFGRMPDWINGASAGTYMYTVSDNDGKSWATAVPHDNVKNVPTLPRPKASAEAWKPTCTSANDGIIDVWADLGDDTKCATGLRFNVVRGSIIAASMISFNTNGHAEVTGLPSGTYTIEFLPGSTSGTGCICTPAVPNNLTVVVPEANDNDASLACIDRINISSAYDDHGCTVTVSLDDVMLGVNNPCDSGNDEAEYIVVREKQSGHPVEGEYLDEDLRSYNPRRYQTYTQTGSGYAFRFDASYHFGKEVKVEVHDEMSGNHCWGVAKVEDKLPPIVSCTDPSLRQVRCIDFEGDMAEALRNRAADCSDVDVTIVRSKEIPDCEGSVLKRVELIYYAEDEWGNKSNTCHDTIEITRIGMADPADDRNKTLTFVDSVRLLITEDREKAWDRALQCDDYIDLDKDGAPDPVNYTNGAGFPMLEVLREDGSYDTLPLPALNYKYYSDALNAAKNKALTYCKIGANYQDILIGSFDCTTKYMRTWTVYEWSCDGELDTSWQQVIEIVDDEAPSFKGHEIPDAVVSVNSYSCTKYKAIKMPEAWDNCTAQEDLTYQAIVYNKDWEIIGPDIKDGYDFEFPYGRNYVVYTAFDACHNAAKDTAIVDVIDKTPPVTVCKEFLVVGISVDGTVRVPYTSFDNYSYDDCSLESICVVRMDDQEAFDALDANDEYPNDGYVLMSDLYDVIACDRADHYAKYAHEHTYDKKTAVYLYRDYLCQNDVWFCCADNEPTTEGSEADDVMVILRAQDYSGNRNECMVSVDIQDKTKPTIECPPYVYVDCELPLPSVDEDKLGTFVPVAEDPFTALFGTITGEHDRQKLGVHKDHVLNDDYTNLVDGVWYDNCSNPAIFVKVDMHFDQCNTGYISRTFYAVDGSGNRSNECTQHIYVNSELEFDYKNIVWPKEDTTIVSCMKEEDIKARMFGVPSAPDGACMLFGTSYEDQVFRFNNKDNPESDACFKLIRTWNVIDWCNKDHNGGSAHTIGYKQIIKVNDPDGPSLTCSDAGPVETFDCYGATVELMATASDECTDAKDMYWNAKIDLDNDGTYDYKLDELNDYIAKSVVDGNSVATLTHKFPLGTHRIFWVSEDLCGNRETCEATFTVTLTKAPTPYAVDVSTVLMSTGTVDIWASDLNNKSEGPCGLPVSVGIVRASADTLDGANITDALTFDCQDFVDGPRVAINFYAYQYYGEQVLKDYTTVYVTLQDNSGACDGVAPSTGGDQSASAVIGGSIRTASSVSIPDMEVGLLGGNQGASTLGETKTNTSGRYAFPAMSKGGSYVVDPVSTTDYLNGVSTLDLVKIQRYVLGLDGLDGAYNVIAADINNDGRISASDLAELRGALLGRTNGFENNDSWRFIDAAYKFANEANPLAEQFPEAYSISGLNSDMQIDFVGVKIGDVNSSVDAAGALAQSRSAYAINVADQDFNAGEIISVTMRASDAIDMIGMQFTSTFATDKLAFAGIESGAVKVSADNINVTDGTLTASWNDVVAQTVSSDDAIITINFKALATGTLSESFAISSSETAAEIYNGNLETMAISVAYTKETTQAVAGFELYQNTPNPFAENTSIAFYLPEAGTATLTVYDVTGKVLKLTKGSFDKGMNTIELSKGDLAATGVMFYTLETAGFTETKRMVVLK